MRERTARAMFVRPFREAAAAFGVFLVCLLPVAGSAAGHPMSHEIGMPHSQGFAFPIGHPGTTIRLRDFSPHARETMKPVDVPAPPKPVETAFPSFSNPLHRHRMALIAF